MPNKSSGRSRCYCAPNAPQLIVRSEPTSTAQRRLTRDPGTRECEVLPPNRSRETCRCVPRDPPTLQAGGSAYEAVASRVRGQPAVRQVCDAAGVACDRPTGWGSTRHKDLGAAPPASPVTMRLDAVGEVEGTTRRVSSRSWRRVPRAVSAKTKKNGTRTMRPPSHETST